MVATHKRLRGRSDLHNYKRQKTVEIDLAKKGKNMAFRIKTITEPKGNRCSVTIEEIDVTSNPTGREFTLPFSVVDKDWAGLKQRFKKVIEKDNTRIAKINTLRTEAENANLTQITPA